MLDKTNPDETLEDQDDDLEGEVEEDDLSEDAGEDTLGGEGGEQEGNDELSIVIGDDDQDEDVDDSSLSDSGKRALHRLRETAKEKSREARELRARLAEIEEAKPKQERPAMPTLEECGYNDAEYAKRMKAYVKAETEAEAAETAEKEANRRAEEDYNARMSRYSEAKRALKVRDFDAAEDAIRDALTPQQQAILVRNLDDPATVVYALGRSQKALAELASIKDHDRFAYRLAKLEGEIKVTQKSPPPPESNIGRGSGAPPSSTAEKLERAKKEADRTGDYTKYFKLRRSAG